MPHGACVRRSGGTHRSLARGLVVFPPVIAHCGPHWGRADCISLSGCCIIVSQAGHKVTRSWSVLCMFWPCAWHVLSLSAGCRTRGNGPSCCEGLLPCNGIIALATCL